MEKQPSSIVIYKRGNGYYADARGSFGGGYSCAHAGNTPEEAALFAARERGRYIDTNPLGGELIMPEEVREALKNATV